MVRGIAYRCAFVLAAVCGLSTCASVESRRDGEAWIGSSVGELRAELDAGRVTSVQLVRAFLRRIDALDRKGPTLRAVVALNPDVIQQARELDQERMQGQKRGPLHGIPLLLKDNIETADAMPTTAGSLALARNFAREDAPIVANLRAAGAIILGKTNLSEWANFRSDRSISGWSAVGGLTKNPHVLDRTPCGSSAGSAAAVAALYAPLGIGTETDGSITCPASMNGIVGLKPTHGLLSQAGIVPIAHSQDTAGPMARSVLDVATLLGGMVGGAPHDCSSLPGDCRSVDYAAALQAFDLRGKRIGVWRFRPGRYPAIEAALERALAVFRDSGATVVEVQSIDSPRIRLSEEIVLMTEFKADLNAYLATTPRTVAVRSLEQLIAFNSATPRETVLFGQELMVRANAAKSLDDPAYRTAVTDSKRLAGPDGIDKLLAADKLDFIVAPTTGPAWRIDLVAGDQFPGSFSTLPAVSGYPHLTVPLSNVRGLPVGLSFIGRPWSEAELLGAAHVYERLAGGYSRAEFKATIETDDSTD